MKSPIRGLIFDVLAMLAFLAVLVLCDRLCFGDEPTIIWPRTPVMTEPLPPPTSRDIDTLKPDEWLVVESSVQLFVRHFPEGIIDVESTTGPMRVRGRFADGNGKIETREYRAAFVYFLTTTKTGVVGVDLTPAGVLQESAISRHVLTCTDGTQPMPPPIPPGPGPKPEPIPPTVKNVSIAIVEDTMQRSPGAAILLNRLVAWGEFCDAGNDWRLYDLKTKEERGKDAVDDSGGHPGLVIYSKDSARRILFSGPVPATIEDLKALVGRLTGG